MRAAPGRLLTTVAAGALCLTVAAQSPLPTRGIQDPAWSPDGRRLAFSFIDRIWTSAPDGRGARPLRSGGDGIERDPAWSPDGRSIAFAESSGAGFDIVVAGLDGRGARRVTTIAGDERWPSWTRDGRIVFAHRAMDRWQLFVVDAAGGEPVPLFADAGTEDEREPRVSPDGRRIAFISDRESDDGDPDVWVGELNGDPGSRIARARLAPGDGIEAAPAWAPDGSRVAFFAVRDGVGSVWVASAEGLRGSADEHDRGARRPSSPPVLVSRRGGTPAWSPDGKRIAIAEIPPPQTAYNGQPHRSADDPPPLFVDAFRLWMVDAPLPVDSGARALAVGDPPQESLSRAFDRVWQTLRRLYYASGPGAAAWETLRAKYWPQAHAARDEAALEAVIDRLVAEQPLIKPAVTSGRAVVVSGHPLASRAGALALEKGGNVVDAAIAASFALGVVEPEASGIGGDGMALLYLKGMHEPVVVDFKDQVPIRATRDLHDRLRRGGGEGPAAINTPGVVAGMDLLYRRYASRTVSWADLLAPAIGYAEDGFELDEALPTTIVETRRLLEKYEAARKIFLPAGRVPRRGDRFVNRDYAATLRSIARQGARAFYRGGIAQRIADDMARSGGLISLDDLAQYRAIERRPLVGRYRDHLVFTAPPPVSTGAMLIETLQILENYRPRPGASHTSDAEYFHYAIESWKVRDPLPRIADPGMWDVDLGPHLEPSHAAELFTRIDRARASRYTAPDRSQTPPAGETGPDSRIGGGTTALTVADADGNMIAVTQTLSTWGGAFYVSEGLGFLYNNHLRFGSAAAPGRFLPLARSTSTSAPSLVFRSASDARERPGTPVLAVGAAGNAWIPASVYGIILNVIDTRLSAQRAIEAPRFLVGRHPMDPDAARVQIEDRIARDVLRDLAARGHRFEKIGRKGEVRYGYAAAVVVDTARREVQGGAEPRRSHAAVGLSGGS